MADMMAAAPVNRRTVHRKIGTVQYNANQRNSLELDKDGVLLDAHIRAQFTVTNGATGPTGANFQTLARLINRVEVIVGGRDTVQSIPGHLLAARATVERGIVPYGMDATVVATSGAVTSYDIILPLDFTQPLARRPEDTGLDLRGIGQAAVNITWGSGSDLHATNPGVVSAVTCTVEGRYLLNPNPERSILVRALDYQEETISASNTAMSVTLDSRTGQLFTSFLMVATDGGAGDDDVLNSVRIEAGPFVYMNRDAEMIKASMRELYQFAPQTGVYYLDPRVEGSLLNGIDTSPGAIVGDLKAIMDVTVGSGTTKLFIQKESVRPLKLA